ncbi:hypothetical protein KR009_003172 [Drosophila setifemur]|nr:hypothetical protein KR009_003172 [Drosophila setifemur]
MYKSVNSRLWVYLCAIIISWETAGTTLIYTTNSEFGIFMAISVPISLAHRNCFLSYNYEFNYYQPEHVYKYPPILMGQNFEDGYLTYPTTGREDKDWKLAEGLNSTGNSSQATIKREKRALTLMSRTVFYAMIKDKLSRSGFPAEACLLRLICDTNASQLGEVNGFLGSLVHIIFSPSSSKDEHLPEKYYQAEYDGRILQNCSAYAQKCRENVLDLISVPLEQALSDFISRRRRK